MNLMQQNAANVVQTGNIQEAAMIHMQYRRMALFFITDLIALFQHTVAIQINQAASYGYYLVLTMYVTECRSPRDGPGAMYNIERESIRQTTNFRLFPWTYKKALSVNLTTCPPSAVKSNIVTMGQLHDMHDNICTS